MIGIRLEQKGQTYYFQPLEGKRKQLVMYLLEELGINQENIKVCYQLEVLRIVKKDFGKSCAVIAACVCENYDEDEMIALSSAIVKENDKAGVAAALIYILAYHLTLGREDLS